MIASLAVLLGIAHLPVEPGSPRLGWHQSVRQDHALVGLSDLEAARTSALPRPITRFREPEQRDPSEAGVETQASLATPEDDPPKHFSGLPVLPAAPQMPQIVGGPGALYLHIDYPRQAVRDRIEGRLMLSFIVDTEGRTNDVRVVESLHPVCDSAAVAALRKTRFVPGRSGGEPISMRMQLPIRFRLVPP